MDRNETIKIIKAALKRRSGRSWSVTGGRGTAWGWIDINVPPSLRKAHHRLKDGCPDWPENYEEYVDDNATGHITPADRDLLAKLLGLESVHQQGVSIPASNDYYREYIERAEGKPVTKIAQPYWD